MIYADFIARLAGFDERVAFLSGDTATSYSTFCKQIAAWRLADFGISSPCIVALRSDFSPQSVSLFLALMQAGCVVALLPDAPDHSLHLQGTGCRGVFESVGGEICFRALDNNEPVSPLVAALLERGGAGFVIYSSGSSGRPKAILHDIDRFLGKFSGNEPPARILTVFLFDHIAGLDRLFLNLVSGGMLVLPERRDAATVCRLIEQYRVEVLPVSPSFVNLLMLSGAYRDIDLSSLTRVTYGSEPMSTATLTQLRGLFPTAELQQTYGTSELGSLRVASQAPDSLWIRRSGDYFEWQVRDNVLWVRASTAMLGYLHSDEQCFDELGWYCTGDIVEQDGEWIHIVGRDSDIIIVGGEKVYPGEVETVIEAFEGVVACVVKGEPNPILGNMIVAILQVDDDVDFKAIQQALRKHCRAQLAAYKVPVKFVRSETALISDRNKKRRSV